MKNNESINKNYLINSLNFGLKNGSGRPAGSIILYHRGGGVKNKYKLVDFSRALNYKLSFKVLDLIYDPIRTANIALIIYTNGIFSYIIASEGVLRGQIFSNVLHEYTYLAGGLSFLRFIKRGTLVNSIGSAKQKYHAIFARAAGTSAVVLGRYFLNYILVKLPSRKFYLFLSDVSVVVGRVSNINQRFLNFRKAGICRRLNHRPITRGVAMNPVDHPHGGGEGKSSGGRHPVSPWGFLTKSRQKTKKKSRVALVSSHV